MAPRAVKIQDHIVAVIERRFPGARRAYDGPNGEVWRLDWPARSAQRLPAKLSANSSTVTIGLATGTEKWRRSTNKNMPASDAG